MGTSLVGVLVFFVLFFHADLVAGEKEPGKIATSFHVAGDWWEIPGLGGGAGVATKDLEVGKLYALRGIKGWTVELEVSDQGIVSIGKVDKGPMMAEPPDARLMPQSWAGRGTRPVRVTMPPQEEILLDLHPAYGAYSVAGYPMKWTGLRTVFLPAGRYPVKGDMGWVFDLILEEQGVRIAEPVAGPFGRTVNDIVAKGRSVVLGPPEAARVILAIPESAGSYEIPGVLSPGSGNRAVWLPPGEYALKGGTWSVNLSVGDGPLDKAVLTGGGEGGVNVKAAGEILTWAPPRKVAPQVEESALYAFVQLGRVCFRRGETVRLSIALRTPGPLKGQLKLQAISAENGEPTGTELLAEDWEGVGPRITRTFDIDTTALAPGTYELAASFGELKSNTPRIIVARGENERTTPFAICSYTHLDAAFEEKNLFNVDQPNDYGPHCLGPRVDEKSRQRYEAAWADPRGKPYEINQSVPGNQTFLEDLTRHSVDAMLQYGCAHQYFHYGTCPADPRIRQAVARGAGLMVQASRYFDSFRALVIGDEVGWPRWPDIWLDDACPYCEQDFEKQTGKPVPRTTEDADLFRAWMIYKQVELANFFDYVGRRAEKIMPDVEINTQQGNLNFYTADGGYPPINQKPLTLTTAHWYPDGHGSLTPVFGHELVRMGPRHIPYWPLVWTTNFGWLWMTGEEARHDIYLAASRQTEGVNHFPGFTAPKTPQFAQIIGGEVHPNLTRNGDLLLKLRRDAAGEIAVFYSFEEQHRDCCFTDRIPYRRAKRHVETVALAYFSLIRSHFQAGLVSEEDILAGKLKGRPALMIVGITRMRPEVKKEIEAYAAGRGKVLADAETSVAITGAERIDCRFDGLWRREAESTWPGDDKLYNKETVAAVENAFAAIVPRPAVAGSPLAIITRLKGGQGDYVWVVNDNVVMGSAAPEGNGFKAMPLKDTITLPQAPAIYEVFSGRKMDGPIVKLNLAPGDARLFACLPAAPTRVNLAAKAQKVGGRNALAWRAEIADADGKPISAPMPIQVSVSDSAGTELATLYRSTFADGPATGTYVLPATGTAGDWTVRVTSLLGGASSAAAVEGATPSAAAEFITETDAVMPVTDAAAIKETIKGANALYVVIGDMTFAKQADAVAGAVRKLGRKADVRLANELRYKELDRMFGYGLFRKWTPDIGGPLTAVDRPCIVIGTPINNPFIADVMTRSEIVDQLVTPDYPGPGKGVVLHVWTAFSYVHNAVIVSGSDVAGITKAVSKLIQIASE